MSRVVPVSGHPASIGTGIVGVTAGTPAAGVGLAPGDVVRSLGAHAVTSAAGLRSAIDAYYPQNTASVSWADQSGQAHMATVVFTAAPVG